MSDSSQMWKTVWAFHSQMKDKGERVREKTECEKSHAKGILTSQSNYIGFHKAPYLDSVDKDRDWNLKVAGKFACIRGPTTHIHTKGTK